jgi:K+ transporter
LTLAALGIVYGDIGTSPLYAAKQTFHPAHGIAVTPYNVLGGVSAIFWALMIVVTLKYVILICAPTTRRRQDHGAARARLLGREGPALARPDHDRGRVGAVVL